MREGARTAYNAAMGRPLTLLRQLCAAGLVLAASLLIPSAAFSQEFFPQNGTMPAGWVTSAGANAGWAVSNTSVFQGTYSLKSALPALTNANHGQQAAVEVTDVSSGWFDAGVVNGQNKLVPSVTFKIRKKTDAELSSVSLNLLFKREGEDAPYDEVFLQRVAFNGEPVTVRAETGYTADPPQSRADMLQHSVFRDVSVQIFAKQSSAQWVELQRVSVPRRVLTN